MPGGAPCRGTNSRQTPFRGTPEISLYPITFVSGRLWPWVEAPQLPQALLAKKMGFRELVSYEKLGIVYPYNTVTTLRQTVSKNSELLERVLKTLIEGIAIFKTNKQKSIAVWRKYLRGASDEVMEESYQSTVGEMEQVPLPSLPVIKSGLHILSLEYPQAEQTDANLIIDSSLVRRIEQSGFIDGLYKK